MGVLGWVGFWGWVGFCFCCVCWFLLFKEGGGVEGFFGGVWMGKEEEKDKDFNIWDKGLEK